MGIRMVRFGKQKTLLFSYRWCYCHGRSWSDAKGDPKECGVYISGEDPASVDTVATTLMGFDWRKLPVVYEAFSKHEMPISEIDPQTINIVSDIKDWRVAWMN